MRSERVKKWTPGPWVMTFNPMYAVNNTAGKHVAMVSCWVGYPGEHIENEANGHLVSAAPYLAEALELIVRRLMVDIEDGERPDQWSMQALVDKAESALSKAYGET